MTVYYLDSSALIKRYVDENGSAWVRSIFAEREYHTFIIAEITLVEVSSAFARRQRSGDISGQMRERYELLFLADLADCRTVPLDMAMVKAAIQCCHRFGLKAYDAVQLATALTVSTELQAHGVRSLSFVSADRDLLAAAAAPDFLLLTIDPNIL